MSDLWRNHQFVFNIEVTEETIKEKTDRLGYIKNYKYMCNNKNKIT
jgi:hypothetical protein